MPTSISDAGRNLAEMFLYAPEQPFPKTPARLRDVVPRRRVPVAERPDALGLAPQRGAASGDRHDPLRVPGEPLRIPDVVPARGQPSVRRGDRIPEGPPSTWSTAGTRS